MDMFAPQHFSGAVAPFTNYEGHHRYGIVHIPLGDRSRDRLRTDYGAASGYVWEERDSLDKYTKFIKRP